MLALRCGHFSERTVEDEFAEDGPYVNRNPSPVPEAVAADVSRVVFLVVISRFDGPIPLPHATDAGSNCDANADADREVTECRPDAGTYRDAHGYSHGHALLRVLGIQITSLSRSWVSVSMVSICSVLAMLSGGSAWLHGLENTLQGSGDPLLVEGFDE